MIVLFHIQLIGAQELSNTPHMMNNLSFFNPAFIGKDYYIKVNGQLNVFATDNSDRIYHQGALNFEHRLNKINSGISIQASQHEIGPFRKNSILVGYSYFIPLKKENQALRFGISGGLRNNQSSLVSLGNENFSITPNQLVLNTGIAYSSEYFNIGYSFMQVNGKHRWTENSLPFYSGHTIYTDYTFKVLRGKNTTLKSGLIVNFIDQSFDFYFINKLNFNHRLYLLAGFTNGAIYNYGYTLGIGFTFLDKYSLGYALEIRQLSKLVPSHKAYNNELIFGYHLNKKQSKHKNTIGTPTF
jgi:hypothetical protein